MNERTIVVGSPEFLTEPGIEWLNRDEAKSSFYYVSEKRDEELRRRALTVDAALAYLESRRESYAWRFFGPQFRGETILERVRRWWRQFCGKKPPMQRHHRPSLFTQPQPEQPPIEESCIVE